MQDRRVFGASCLRIKVGTERTTAKKRRQSPRRTATPAPATEGEKGRGKDDIGSCCSGTVSRELTHPAQTIKPHLLLRSLSTVVRLEIRFAQRFQRFLRSIAANELVFRRWRSLNQRINLEFDFTNQCRSDCFLISNSIYLVVLFYLCLHTAKWIPWNLKFYLHQTQRRGTKCWDDLSSKRKLILPIVLHPSVTLWSISSSNKTRQNSHLRFLILGILKPSYESLPFTKKKRNVEIRNYAALLR